MCPTAGRASHAPRRRKTKRRVVVATTLLLVIAAGAYLVIRSLAPVIGPVLTGSGCSAAAAHQSVLLDTQQASIAATIAGVAHQQSMPRAAVTIAYATAMQESKLHDLDYGDMDSVGVFQQRPSQGWGPARKLENPVYATTKFFRALQAVHGYQTMPVYQAAQAVQHSADGSAYIQYERMADGDGQRVHRPARARGLLLVGSGEPAPPRRGRRQRGAGQYLRPGHRGAGPDRAAPHHAGPDRARQAGLGGVVLARHPRQLLRHSPGPVRRV